MEPPPLLAVFWMLIVLVSSPTFAQNNNSNVSIIDVGVGVIVDESSWVAETLLPAFQMAADDINNQNFLGKRARLVLHFNNSAGDPILAATQALKFLEQKQVASIIGPLHTDEATFVADLCQESNVPVISYSVTDPAISGRSNPFFFRLPHNDAAQTEAIAAVVGHFGWPNVAVIYSDDDYGSGILQYLALSLNRVGAKIAHRSGIPATASTDFVRAELYKVATMQTRVLLLHMTANPGLQLLCEATALGLLDQGFVWIVTEAFATKLDVMEPAALNCMQGVLATRTFFQNDTLHAGFAERWRDRYARTRESSERAAINAYVYYAYDSVWAVARAVAGLPDREFRFSDDGGNVNVLVQGAALRERLAGLHFPGVSGRVWFQDGEIPRSSYEILNIVGEIPGSSYIVGKGYQRVALWSSNGEAGAGAGLSGDSCASGSGIGIDGCLDSVTWPGQTSMPPRGWANPNLGKKLRIAVPLRIGSPEFISYEETKKSDPAFVITGGFVIDVFKAVLENLPYALPYEFVAVGKDNVTAGPDYNTVVQMVSRKEVDAVVGDITILANRTNYVDFSQQYLESGLVMVVKTRNQRLAGWWTFTWPFTASLWCLTGISLIGIGFVIWFLEHKSNEDFRKEHPVDQVVTMIWFAFSTLVFAYKEEIKGLPAKAVLLAWLPCVLVITTSYTASLTSMLTVEYIEPVFKDFESLNQSGMKIGHKEGSYTREWLLQQFNVSPQRLVALNTSDEYEEALNNERVGAIFANKAHLQVFLSQRCGFVTAGPVYRTGGFGFAFPHGSALVSDVSEAILNLSESKEMDRIANKWLNSTACTQVGAQVSSNSLGVQSLLGLFLIAGVASVLLSLMFLCSSVVKYYKDPRVSQNQNRNRRNLTFLRFMTELDPSVSQNQNRNQRQEEEERRIDAAENPRLEMERAGRRKIEIQMPQTTQPLQADQRPDTTNVNIMSMNMTRGSGPSEDNMSRRISFRSNSSSEGVQSEIEFDEDTRPILNATRLS